MHRSASCGPGKKKHYMRPTASSMAQRHPRAASIDMECETPRRGIYAHSIFQSGNKHRSTRSEIPAGNYLKGTASSRAKQKHRQQRWSPPKSLRSDLQSRPKKKKTGGTKKEESGRGNIVATKRAPSAMSEAHSIGDSALGTASSTKLCSWTLHGMSTTPEPPQTKLAPQTPIVIQAPAKTPPTAVNKSTPETAAIVLSLLYRMNKPKPVVTDLFDLVVAVNRKHQKKKGDVKWKSRVAKFTKKIAQLFPSLLHDLGSRELSFSSLVGYVQKRAFLVAFPFVLLRLALQFPTILATVLTVTQGRWSHVRPSEDMFFLESILPCAFPFRPVLSAF